VTIYQQTGLEEMFGQGSPQLTEMPRTAADRRASTVSRYALVGASVAMLLLAAVAQGAEEVELRLRAAWGGGTPRPWEGRITLEGVSGDTPLASGISEVSPLGLSPDEPGSMHVAGATLHISPRTPRDYDGVDFRLRAPRDSTLVVELTTKDQPGPPPRVTIPVAYLIEDLHSSLLDDRGNQLRIRRQPGDQLQVRFDRDNLVFQGGERFDFSVVPHLLGVEPGVSLTCDLALRDSRDADQVWEDTREVRIDARGDAPEIGPFSVPLPDRDGVFDLTITLSKKRLPTPFTPVKVIAQRTVQFVVLSARASEGEAVAWKELGEIVPRVGEVASLQEDNRSRLWSPLPKLPHWWWLPGSAGNEAKRPLGNGKSAASTRLGEGFVELAPGGWQAYPLPTGQLQRPHLLELEYPADAAQGLNIRVIEADASGLVTPFGPGSGLDIARPASQLTSRVARHRLVFWPRTQTPLLLVTNNRPDVPATFGRIRILNGPRHLPPAELTAKEDGRLLSAYYDRPLFPQDFSATDTVDLVTGRSLNDWQTFCEGSSRLVEYLRYAGYNGVMLCVLHDGGTIYPSRLLEPTPRYDSGTFFGTGQDAVRKDALELTFRLFDRHGLRLIPMLQFSSPLPELERLLRSADSAGRATASVADVRHSQSTLTTGVREGIELVGGDGRPWRESTGASQAAGPYYNPLDPRVQQAMRRVVIELVDRYGHHDSFGGVAIRLGPETYAQLPDLAWALDRETLARFAKQARVSLPVGSPADNRRLLVSLTGDQREAWSAWRAQQLADFYHTMQSDLTDRVSRARLYLAGADMLAGTAIQSELHPRLPERLDWRQLMLRVGIDPLRYADSDRLVLLRPERIAPLISLEDQASNLQLRLSPELDRLHASAASAETRSTGSEELRSLTGSLFYHEPQTLIPESFQEVSPYGAEKTSGWFLDQTIPAGDRARQRLVHSLASMDSQVIADGGWVAGQGPIDSVMDFVSAYRRLPAARFVTVPSASAGDEAQPVVVRRLSTGQQTYLYVVNDAPWPVSVSIDLDDRRPFDLEVLGDRPLPGLTRSAGKSNWNVDLKPYDLVAARLSAPDVAIRDWRVELGREVLVELRQAVDDMRKRIGWLSNPQPLPVLTNPGFETPPNGTMLPGWEHARGEGIIVRTQGSSAHSGERLLQVKSSGPVVWVRSNPFPTPQTGRLAVFVWLKIDDPERQPPLQLAIEGRLKGEIYYRPARVGAPSSPGGAPPPPLTESWAPYLVRVDNLPPDVTDLRVAIDVMGAGEVSVDDVQVFDLWFDKTERNELLKLTALANLYLGKGAAVDCERMIRGYWAEFLRRNVRLEEAQLVESGSPDAASTDPGSAASPEASSEEPEASTSWLQRIVPKPPKLPKLFR